MSDHGSRTEARSERATSVHSHYSHDSRNRDRDEDPDARRRRKEADREYERQRDRERQREGSTARSHRHSSRDYDHDRTREYDDDHRRRRAHDYDRDRNRDRDLDPAGPAPDDADDYDRAHKRRRSSSRDYDRDRDYDRERERERERRHSRPYDDYYDHGRRSSRRGHDYDDRPPPRRRRSPSYEPPRRQRSPELTEEQREMRSVFVSQLAARVTDRELGIFFEHHAGKVRDARVIVDRISRRSKGVGYVEFVELETVQKALTLSGTKLLGIPVQVQYTEAEKNRQARDGTSGASNGGGGGSGSAPMTGGLYVGSLNFALTSDDIREVFQPFGELEAVELHRDPATGKSKGYCFVKFKEHKDAMVAIEKMNNFPLAGREIKVGLVADRSATFSQHVGAQQQQEGQLEREEHTGKLDANTRIELMQKLSRVDRPPDLPPTPMFRPNIPQNITRNVLMKNAFNPEEETERDWDLELADDVKTECEAKYGPVVDIYVVKESTEGEIYIRFASPDVAVKALQGLNGRWFGGKQIAASHVGDSLFDAKK